MDTDNMDQAERKQHYMGVGMAIGMSIFVPTGIVLALGTDNPGLLGIGPALGISIGIAIGESLFQRNENQANDKEPQDEGN
jgi:hypothetical protein